METAVTSPFTRAARDYRAAGWAGTLPLPERRKYPPPDGHTGHRGNWPTTTQVEAWAELGGNIGLRLPPDIIGLDVDHYDQKDGGGTLANLVDRYGPLPPTVLSTSRGDGISGIRLYRVPNGTTLVTRIEGGIELVQHHHRYVVAWPSVHPEGGQYRWIDEASGEVLEQPPDPDTVPELPWPWIDALGTVISTETAEGATPDRVRAFVDIHTEDRRPSGLTGVLNAAKSKIEAGNAHHDTLVTAACWAMREAAAGYYPAERALNELGAWWRNTMTGHTRKPHRGEFAGAVAWAVGQADNEPDRVAKLRTALDAAADWIEQLKPADVELVTETPRRGLTFRQVDTYNTDPPPDPDPLVAGLIDRGEFTVIGAERGVGKTWLGYNLAILLARGEGHLFGHLEITQPCRVLYLQGELDERQARLRWNMLTYARGWDLPNVAESFDRVRIKVVKRRTTGSEGGQSWSDEWMDAVVDDRLVTTIEDMVPDVVIVDPWAVYFGGNENNNDEVEAALSELRGLTQRWGVTWVLFHHFGKSSEAREPEDLWRGASRLPDWAANRVTIQRHWSKKQAEDRGLTRQEARRFLDVSFLRRGAPLDDLTAERGQDGWWTMWQPDEEPTGRGSTVSDRDVLLALIRAGGEWRSDREAATAIGCGQATAKGALVRLEQAGEVVRSKVGTGTVSALPDAVDRAALRPRRGAVDDAARSHPIQDKGSSDDRADRAVSTGALGISAETPTPDSDVGPRRPRPLTEGSDCAVGPP